MLAVVGAGLGAGIVVTAIGAGSLVSFPILLAVGVRPQAFFFATSRKIPGIPY